MLSTEAAVLVVGGGGSVPVIAAVVECAVAVTVVALYEIVNSHYNLFSYHEYKYYCYYVHFLISI